MQTSFSPVRLLAVAALALVMAPAAWAQVSISEAWVRATTGSQSASAAYMVIKADSAVKITGVQSPVAGVAEIHQMSMDANDRMVMRSMQALDIPAGQAVELKPGGLHLMLMDLKTSPLKPGDTVLLALTMQSADGKTSQQEVKATVRPMAGAKPGKTEHHHHHHHHH
jgi:copper(I)-binding protein